MVTWKSASTSSKKRFERFVGAVDLVDQQHRRAGGIGLERLQQRPLDQEALREHVVLEPRAVVARPRPRRRGWRSSARHSSTHRPRRRRRGPRSIAAGSAGGRASTTAPWRSRSCRRRPRLRERSAGPCSAPETAPCRASGRRDIRPRRGARRWRRWRRAAGAETWSLKTLGWRPWSCQQCSHRRQHLSRPSGHNPCGHGKPAFPAGFWPISRSLPPPPGGPARRPDGRDIRRCRGCRSSCRRPGWSCLRATSARSASSAPPRRTVTRNTPFEPAPVTATRISLPRLARTRRPARSATPDCGISDRPPSSGSGSSPW